MHEIFFCVCFVFRDPAFVRDNLTTGVLGGVATVVFAVEFVKAEREEEAEAEAEEDVDVDVGGVDAICEGVRGVVTASCRIKTPA